MAVGLSRVDLAPPARVICGSQVLGCITSVVAGAVFLLFKVAAGGECGATR